MTKRVLVTTGATFPFDDLVCAAFDDSVLRALSAAGVTDLRVQYGSTATSAHLFRKLVSSNRELLDSLSIRVSGFATTDTMVKEITDAWVVISHAGTGTILDTLRVSRTPPALIVVPNAMLMHGHQAEVANALVAMKCLVSADISVSYRQLATAISSLKHVKMEKLPKRESLASVINYEAGVVG
ncbi:uncharacterized protein V1518DRAFT_414576 [Limtongia smithiae]|uniref:uncharacterized protein n=1 Tax=Limtongia smithiae TaxID=1125753 RepID=UPI0034CEEFEF